MNRRLADVHADWLRLVEPEGQFLTMPVLRRAFPNGLDAIDAADRDALRKRYPKGANPTQEQWDAWITWVLRDVLDWAPCHLSGADAAAYAREIPEHGIALQASDVLRDPKTGEARVLVMRYPHGTVLDKRITGDRWNTSPIDRLKELCKCHGVRFGLVTDGERISLVWIPAEGTGGYATWDTSLFTESRERGVFQSFVNLLRAYRFFAVQEDAQIESLFEASEKAQSEVTDQLGFQIRQAVELLVNALSRANLERNEKLLAGIPPQRVYEAAVTVMMRLVFLLYAEERDLLPLSEPLYADCYAVSTLREQLDEQAAMEGDEPLERRNAAWYRLLATFRVIYAGLKHDRLSLPAYGGRLFDPDRFPFLEGRPAKQSWRNTTSHPVPVDDLTVKAILEAIQTLPIRENGSNERRRLSFRSLDVEQIGHVYEGLLDHGAVRVDEVYVGLVGKSGDEAEIALSEIQITARKGERELTALLAQKTKRSEGAVGKILDDGRKLVCGDDPETRRLLNTVCDNDLTLSDRVAPYVYGLRRDLHGLPVVFNPGSLVVKQTRARRDSGTEYTPRELAEETVHHELEPLVYSPGPRDGVESDKWKLRSAKELLDLKICDPAVGSGAFLVSACRYLADRVVEAWVEEDPQRAKLNRDDLTLDARRAVVDRCLYGVDRDSMAVEMAKLSLWLITMARERPFSFLDHAIREGDSLLGTTSLEQVLYVHCEPSAGKALHEASLFDVTAAVQPLVERATMLRRQLEDLPNITVRDAEEKQRLNDESESILLQIRFIADGVIATALAAITDSETRRELAFQQYGSLVATALDENLTARERSDAIERLGEQSAQFLNADRPENAPPRTPFHWPLAFPEVFHRENGGFDAIIGNPPFLGNRSWKASYGELLQRIVHLVLGVPAGKIDLSAAFHRRAVDLLRNGGNYALLATSNIAEGSAIAAGLGRIVEHGEIFRSFKNMPWPNKAAVLVAIVFFHKGDWDGLRYAEGKVCAKIGPRLDPESAIQWQPKQLKHALFAFEGVNNSKGLSFVVTPESQWFNPLKSEPDSLLRPYVTGDDINTFALNRTDRWALDIADRDLDEIEKRWPLAYKFLNEVVKPTRTREALKSYPGLYERWWQYWNHRANLMRRIRKHRQFIAYSKVTKYPVCMLAESEWVYTNQVALIAAERPDAFAICMSSPFRSWIERYSGGKLEGRLRISITEAILTFPLPSNAVSPEGVSLAAQFNATAVGWAAKNGCGLTEAMNAVNDPEQADAEIAILRQLLAQVDYDICLAYGWHDLDVTYAFRSTKAGIRWTLHRDVCDEFIDRLLLLNQAQYGEEVDNGMPSENGKAPTRSRKQIRKAEHESQIPLMVHADG